VLNTGTYELYTFVYISVSTVIKHTLRQCVQAHNVHPPLPPHIHKMIHTIVQSIEQRYNILQCIHNTTGEQAALYIPVRITVHCPRIYNFLFSMDSLWSSFIPVSVTDVQHCLNKQNELLDMSP
jgi:hypothetical protein